MAVETKKIINLKAFREDTEKYIRAIEKGDSFVVFKRSKPVFELSPIESGEWETVIDFTKVKRGGILVDDLLARL